MYRPLINKSNAELVALVGTDQQSLAEREIRFRKMSAQLAFARALESRKPARKPAPVKTKPAPKPAPKPVASRSKPAPKPAKPAKPAQEAFRLAFAAAKAGDPTTPGKVWTAKRAYGRVLRGEPVETAVKAALEEQARALALA